MASASSKLGVLVAAASCLAGAISACGGAEVTDSSRRGDPTVARAALPPPATDSRSAARAALPSPGQRGSNLPGPRGFTLLIRTRDGDIRAGVSPISVASRQPVDPPHATPEQWRTAAWVVQAAFPAVPSTGTTYVYGHACRHHTCAFTHLTAAAPGDTVVATTPSQILTYRVVRVGLSPKSASSLPSWASDSTTTNRIVLVTCRFERGDVSVDDLIVTAELASATLR